MPRRKVYINSWASIPYALPEIPTQNIPDYSLYRYVFVSYLLEAAPRIGENPQESANGQAHAQRPLHRQANEKGPEPLLLTYEYATASHAWRTRPERHVSPIVKEWRSTQSRSYQRGPQSPQKAPVPIGTDIAEANWSDMFVLLAGSHD